MPGISGIYSYNRYNNDNIKNMLKCFSNKLRHFSGYCIKNLNYSHVGISRVDIHAKFNREALFDSSKQLIVSLWGELYDSFEYGKEESRKSSPEKIIAKLYNKYGVDVVHKLNGDFNCLIYDDNKKKLILFNDRFGFRPLYYFSDDQYFIFSNELKYITSYPSFKKKIDWQSISDYLKYGYVFGDRTNFKNVSLLPPASCIEVNEKHTKVYTYWEPIYDRTYKINSIDKVADEGIEIFKQSIKRRTNGKKNVLLFLSGGLDSRLIAGVASSLDINITTATQGSNYSYEYKIAKEVCKTLELKPPIRISHKIEWLRENLYNIAWKSESAYGSLGLFWQHGVAKLFTNMFDCMLNGIFGGHLSFGSPYFNRSDYNCEYSDEERILRIDKGFNATPLDQLKKKLHNEAFKKIKAYDFVTIKQEIARAKTKSDHPALIQDAVFLYNRIRRGMVNTDQNDLYFIDSYPYASYELYDFYLKLDPMLTLDHVLYKQIYKRHYKKLAAIPWWTTGINLYGRINKKQIELRNLFNIIDWYLSRFTKGAIAFSHPWTVRYEDKIFRKDKTLINTIIEILFCKQCKDRMLYNQEEIKKLIEDCKFGRSGIGLLEKLVMLELWFQFFVDEESVLKE